MNRQLMVLLFALTGLCAFATQANAQAVITVEKSVLTSGTTIKVTYTDPSKAGQTVQVEMDDGGIPTATTQVKSVTLNADGVGSFDWFVPDWFLVNFNASGADEVTCAIVRPSPTTIWRGETRPVLCSTGRIERS